MTARFNNLRFVRQALTAGEILTTWIGVAIGIVVLALIGFLLGQFYPPRY